MAHALFSPSGAYRWTQCPGSVALSSEAASKDGEASREGTMLHAVMQKNMERLKPLDKFDLTEEQRASCAMCADHIRKLEKDDTFYEIKVCFANAVKQPEKECFGTSDVLVVNGDTLRVIDYKFGHRYVNPYNNPQGLLYMMGAADTLAFAGYEFDNFEFEILQPRLGDEVSNGVYRVSMEELKEKAQGFRKACQEVKLAIESYKPGDTNEIWADQYLRPNEDACTFCPAAATCPKLIAMAMQDAEDMEKAISEFPNGDVMNGEENEHLAQRFARLPILKEYIKAVEAEMMKRLLAGQDIRNYHLVKGREGNRKWGDVDKAKDALHKLLPTSLMMSEPDLLTPAQIQMKLVSAGGLSKKEAKEYVDELTVREAAKPTIAHKDKGGEPWQPDANVAQEFVDI